MIENNTAPVSVSVETTAAPAAVAPVAPAPVAVAPVAAPPPVVAKPAEPAPAPVPVRVLNPWAKREAAAPVDPRVAALEARSSELTSALSTYATTELNAVSESVRNAVRAIAGDDPSAQLKALSAMRANGLGVVPVLSAGSTTAAPVAAPAAAPVHNADEAALAHLEKLRASGSQLLASQFASRNAAAIARATAARASRN